MGILSVESSSGCICLPITLEWKGGSQNAKALQNLGAEGSFLDAGVTARCRIPLVELECPRAAHSFTGEKTCLVTHSTAPVRLLSSGNHQETFSFLITNTPNSVIFLGNIIRVKAVQEWTPPPDRKGLQCSLGFANFLSSVH